MIFPSLAGARRLAAPLWILMAAAILAACSAPASYRTIDGMAWNTTWHITYKSDRDLSDSVITVIEAVDRSLSAFNPTSLVSRVNRGDTVTADALFIEVMDGSRYVWQLSDGAFDPTVGPLINMWGFGPDKHPASSPGKAAIDSVVALVGLDGINVGADGTVEKRLPGMSLNFSAIAKGLACDLVGRMLARNGCEDYMVEIGGEMRLAGNSPKGRLWRIQIDAPLADSLQRHSRMLTTPLTDCGVATSGNYRNYRDLPTEGRIGHTISPRTGMPIATRTLSATVIAPSAMLADAFATAAMAMPTDSAVRMLESIPQVSALLVTADPESDDWILVRTGTFPVDR